jgi:hypothetical protein
MESDYGKITAVILPIGYNKPQLLIHLALHDEHCIGFENSDGR